MARPLRIEFPGAVYHVTSRGNAKGMIFDDEQDRLKFLDVLGSVIKKHRWLCHAYCLLDNHYHLLIETPEGNLSRGMQQLNGIYTQAFNRRHNRPGHLLQGRYKAILVEKDSYLLALCRYIVLNPVAAGMVRTPEDWPWSSYRATAGMAIAPELLTPDWVLAQFAPTRREACRLYRAFVCQGVSQPSPWEKLRGGVFLGNEDFVGRFQSHLSEKKIQEEIPRHQRLLHRPALEDLLTIEVDNRVWDARKAHVEWGYTLKEIAGFWGMHYSTVSRMIKKSDEMVLHGKT
jgi:REP element-mobilizing transposase RayT/phage pi2 protein 07